MKFIRNRAGFVPYSGVRDQMDEAIIDIVHRHDRGCTACRIGYLVVELAFDFRFSGGN